MQRFRQSGPQIIYLSREIRSEVSEQLVGIIIVARMLPIQESSDFRLSVACDHVSSRRKGSRNDRQTITLHISNCLQQGALVIVHDIRYRDLFGNLMEIL
jgi:hypothetical protein